MKKKLMNSLALGLTPFAIGALIGCSTLSEKPRTPTGEQAEAESLTNSNGEKLTSEDAELDGILGLAKDGDFFPDGNGEGDYQDQSELKSGAYLFEDYLVNYDRKEYRNCLRAGKIDGYRTLRSYITQRQSNHVKDLFYCRLSESFRKCNKSPLTRALTRTKFHPPINAKSERAIRKFEKCAAKNDLTSEEKSFYRIVVLGESIEKAFGENGLPDPPLKPVFNNPDGKYLFELEELPEGVDRQFVLEYEPGLNKYNREKFRDMFMNPVSNWVLENDAQALFYGRLFIAFRRCMAHWVALPKLGLGSGLKLTRAEGLYRCKDWSARDNCWKDEAGSVVIDGEKHTCRPGGSLKDEDGNNTGRGLTDIEIAYYKHLMLTEEEAEEFEVYMQGKLTSNLKEAMRRKAEAMAGVDVND